MCLRGPAGPARHPSVRSPPSFRPDLRARHAGARNGGQGWPVFGPPRQRREASLTAASTTAGSTASGLRSPYPTNKPSKSVRERPSKNELTLKQPDVTVGTCIVPECTLVGDIADQHWDVAST